MSDKTDAEHRAAITAQTDQNDAAGEAWLRDFYATADDDERRFLGELLAGRIDIKDAPDHWRSTIVLFAGQEMSRLTARILGGQA